eukprot:scaffold62840_cov51-Phaeocystis_antarctica.AAC.1
METEVSGSLRRTPSRPPRSALGLDGVALRAGACGESACSEISPSLKMSENQKDLLPDIPAKTCQT